MGESSELPVTTENTIASSIKQNVNDLFVEPDNSGNGTTFKKPNASTSSKLQRRESKLLKVNLSADKHLQDSSIPYVEPPWGGKPEEDYKMEVLKSGVIIESIPLGEQSFYIVGRLPSCHLPLAHPTISRYHAVLQYKFQDDEENLKGFYIYDLGSTHGTFWNGYRIKPNVYVRIRGGHMLKFGCSQRKYILQAPAEDQEEESEYSLTQLKEMRASEVERYGTNDEAEASIEDKESEGIDWGISEDADEETDLQENPYACMTDEDLVLEDPKKTLRGWFEREGYDLHYQTEEKGLGQFLCWIDLPMEDTVGHSVRAEALVKGKKKEAVVQCALEACKILDKYGLLRQANHEARKRKTRNWEAEDYYDSDEDNFLDRTGSIERKRAQRMRLAGKLEEKVETYDSLLEKQKKVTKRILHLSTLIKNWQNVDSAKEQATEEDALDAFMSSLSSFTLTKSDVAKMKLELQNLRKEETNLIRLLNLTRPANLPALSSHDTKEETVYTEQAEKKETQSTFKIKKTQAPLFGRKKQRNQQEGTTNSKFLESNAIAADTTVEPESIEEVDSDDSDKKDFEEVTNQRKHEIRITRKDRRHVERKIHCDQDVYAENYSTWIPPQDQAGDGKTSLNEKYGY
ncbi:kanadaptin [Xylocopa sonorina]|uniref:kanadaptin n=1 Tax=Xylocopa sonorina TaxID=1818115 RepID=UPI00403AC245